MISFFRSTIGKKIIVALTGAAMVAFLIGHLLGNLQIFSGPRKINEYAEFLHHAKPLLWGTRIAMLFSILLHIDATVSLNRRNKASRPIPYVREEHRRASAPSMLMIWSGIFLGSYIIFHLLHLTTGTVHPNFDPTDVYANLVSGFSVWYVSLFYIVAMMSLGFHLYHGVWSAFQTLGLNHPKYNALRKYFAVGFSIIISLGYISIPAAVLLGVIH